MKTFFSTVIRKGQVLTQYYRIMNKNGGYTWIQTCATVICNAKNNEEQNIICVNYIITRREDVNLIFDQCQLGIVKREPIVYVKKDNEPRTSDMHSDNSKRGSDNKCCESATALTSMAASLLDHSQKVVERSTKKCQEDEILVTTNKRGRKRKVKFESKDESSMQNTPSMPIIHSNMTENHPDITVRDLESVMSKHLPKASLTGDNNLSDLSAHSLLRQHSDDKSQTIQAAHSSSHFHHQSSSPMPATALLRQLYANRESVIRATTRQSNFMFSDSSEQQSLPTPPNDSYESHTYHRKSGETFSHLVSGYGGYSSMEYNNAMTPPSSVSPRDLTNNKSGSCYDYTSLAPSGESRVHYQSNNQSELNSLHNLPLKPHPYSINQLDPVYSIDPHSQYFPYHTGFHLYHKGVYSPP